VASPQCSWPRHVLLNASGYNVNTPRNSVRIGYERDSS
jgi:hypothetical protein